MGGPSLSRHSSTSANDSHPSAQRSLASRSDSNLPRFENSNFSHIAPNRTNAGKKPTTPPLRQNASRGNDVGPGTTTTDEQRIRRPSPVTVNPTPRGPLPVVRPKSANGAPRRDESHSNSSSSTRDTPPPPVGPLQPTPVRLTQSVDPPEVTLSTPISEGGLRMHALLSDRRDRAGQGAMATTGDGTLPAVARPAWPVVEGVTTDASNTDSSGAVHVIGATTYASDTDAVNISGATTGESDTDGWAEVWSPLPSSRQVTRVTSASPTWKRPPPKYEPSEGSTFKLVNFRPS